MKRINATAGFGVLATLGLLVGCHGPAPAAPDTGGSTTTTASAPKIDYGTDAGVALSTQTDNPAELKNLYASLDVRPRRDPFSLSPQEVAYDREQATERLVQQNGNMDTMYEPPPPPDDTPPVEEPQPYRRVSGILVGDSVLAIIEMGEGSPVIVRPGEYVPNTSWYVVSIDEEKVVLRRSGNVLPKQITIRLEQPQPGMGGGVGGGVPGGIGVGPTGNKGGTMSPPGLGPAGGGE